MDGSGTPSRLVAHPDAPPAHPCAACEARTVGLIVSALVLAVAALAAPQVASAATRTDVVAAAAQYAGQHGFEVAVGVYDQQTGRYYGGGDDYGLFASESVVKVLIAARLVASGQMHGRTETLARRMITHSDNAAASELYPLVGGDGLIDWVKARYDLPHLGYRPRVAGHWGATRITAGGMAHFYAHLNRDPAVRSWLLDAMSHVCRRQTVLRAAAASAGAPSKQGWGFDSDDFAEARADLNSTAFVNDDRYTMALFVRGAKETWGAPIYDAINGAARALLPAGQFPNRAGDHRHVAPRGQRGRRSRCTAVDSRLRRTSCSGSSRRRNST